MPDDLRSERIGELMTSATALFRAIEALRVLSADAENLSATEFRAFARLVEFGPKTPKQLAASMSMSTATVTAVSDSLVARGLLMRVPNANDRRSVLLTATEEGVSMLGTMYDRYRQLYWDGLRTVSTEKLDESRKVLDLITARLEAYLYPDESLTGEPA